MNIGSYIYSNIFAEKCATQIFSKQISLFRLFTNKFVYSFKQLTLCFKTLLHSEHETEFW